MKLKEEKKVNRLSSAEVEDVISSHIACIYIIKNSLPMLSKKNIGQQVRSKPH